MHPHVSLIGINNLAKESAPVHLQGPRGDNQFEGEGD